MSKLKINQKQYQAILLREQKSRLEASGEILSEKVDLPSTDSNENWREVVLGVAQMLGVPLTGHNKILAQGALKSDSVMGQIKATLEDENRLKALVDAFEAKGMKNPSDRLSIKAEKVIDTFNKISANNHLKHKLDTKVVNNLQALKGDKGKDYELNNADITVDTVSEGEKPQISVQDTLEIKFGDVAFAGPDSFTLSPEGIDVISLAVKEIEKQNGKILGVEIETSTDSEETTKFASEEDPTGNIKLADLRTKSVANLINSIDGGASLTHREIPNNGSDVVNTREFKSGNAGLKDKTKEYRYVKITITMVFEGQDTPPEIIKKYRGELIKVINTAGKTRSIDSRVIFNHKKWKCPKAKGSDKGVKCTTF
jgi:hypothetical protein